MNRLRAVGRMMRGLLHIGAGFWLVFVRFPRLQTTHREAAVQAWAQRMLAVCGIGLTIRGEPPAKGPLLATASGTLYIERASRRDAMRVVHHMAEALRGEEVVAIFPEGTTGDGITLLPFHANLIQAAISADAPVVPVGLRFVDDLSGDTSLAPSYVGDESLLGSFWRTLCAPGITALVSYGEPQRAEGRDRRTWAHDLHATIDVLRVHGPRSGHPAPIK